VPLRRVGRSARAAQALHRCLFLPASEGQEAEGAGELPLTAGVTSFTDLRGTYILTKARKLEKAKRGTRTKATIQKEGGAEDPTYQEDRLGVVTFFEAIDRGSGGTGPLGLPPAAPSPWWGRKHRWVLCPRDAWTTQRTPAVRATLAPLPHHRARSRRPSRESPRPL
jgi:hypothetical protein